jgi:hypothetical protein
VADEVSYIERAYLKERLLLRAIPAPKLDSELDSLIQTASGMVKDRCISFDDANPPQAVRRATLMLAMRLRMGETMNHADADGRPVQVRLWTPDIDDVLGIWLADDSPDAPIHAPVAGSLDIPVDHQRAVGVQARRGRRTPWGWSG